MKKLFIFFIVSLLGTSSFGQFVYKIKADSVLITNDSCNAELNLENSTRNVKGFLYNKGNGRTEFRSALIKLNDSVYVIGGDTLILHLSFGGGGPAPGIDTVLGVNQSLTTNRTVNQAGNNLLFSNPFHFTIGVNPPDSISHPFVLNYPSQRNFSIGPPLNWNYLIGTRNDDSSYYNIIHTIDTINETNTSTNLKVGLHPRASLGIVRDQWIGVNNIQIEETGALSAQKNLHLDLIDSALTMPSSSDFVWANKNMTQVINLGTNHRAVLRSGNIFDWDASSVVLSTLVFNTKTGSSTHLRKWWSGYTSYIFGAASDTMDNWVSFYSTDFTTNGLHVNKYYNFASNNFSTSHIDSLFFLFQNPIAGTANSYSYIDGHVGIGGGQTGPKDKLNVVGTVKISDTLKTPNIILKTLDTTNYKLVVVDVNGNHFKSNWPVSAGGSLGDPGGNGLVVRTALNTTINRTITGTSNRISVTNGDGVSGNPTLDIGSDVVTLTGSQTLTNKTLTSPVISSITNTGSLTLPTVTGTVSAYNEITTTSSSTPAPTGDSRVNWYQLTALSANPTFAAPSGTPANHNELYIRILDNGTARTLGWNAIYRASSDLPLPTTTTLSKTMYLKFIYNSAGSGTWDFVGFINNFGFETGAIIISMLFAGLATYIEKKNIKMAKRSKAT